VPLNDRLAPAELAAFLQDVDVSFVVAAPELADLAGSLGPGVLQLAELVQTRVPASSERVWVKTDSPAVIIGTSGTTGRTKGAVLTWGAITASAEAWNWFLPPAAGWLSSLSIAHVGGLGIVWRAALAGVPVVVPGSADLVAQIATPGVSHVSLVAAQLARLLDETENAPPPEGLRAVLLGGGPIPPGLVLRALAAGWPVVPTYGMTETASGVTALPTAEAAARPVSAGRPLAGTKIRIAEVSPDGVGEIEVRGPSMFTGYYGKSAESAAALASDGWFRTGDLGSLDAEGYLTVSDRRLDLIISGGENIYPAEVEAVLLGHPGVADAGVFGRLDRRWGAAPVAALVLRDGAKPSDDELRSFCADRLARFKVPAAFLRVAALPRIGAGKLDRRALREMMTTAPEAARGKAAYQAMPPVQYLDRPGGFQLAYRVIEDAAGDSPVVLLLHSTLSSGWQLTGLARTISEWATVIVPDRRGSGASRLAVPIPVGLDEQVADLVALLNALRVDHVTVFGHSYGAVVALALAAGQPQAVNSVVVYEPPLLEMLSPVDLGDMADVAAVVRAAHASGGASAAAEAFLRTIGGEDVLANASASSRAKLLAEGDGVLADVGSMARVHVELEHITCPLTLATGDASQQFYAAIADAAAAAVPTATRVRLPGARHDAPITQPAAVAELLRSRTVSQTERAANRTASSRSNRPS
jgi:O-succinylbenzoic acid--CoA ligase